MEEFLLAGGLKNLNFTSYINSTLQIFFHFRPFVKQIMSANPHGNNYSLIRCLQIVIEKLKSTDRSVSTDSIISAMNFDPKIGNGINDFFLNFKSLVSFQTIDFELGECETTIQNEINYVIQSSRDFQYNDLNKNFIYVHLKPNNIKLFDVNQSVLIDNIRFTLYAVVQVILSPSSHNHYFVTICDRKGWVRFNDTAVTEMDQTQFIQSLHNLVTPIEILIYIKNISDSEIFRKPASLKSKFTANSDINYDNYYAKKSVIPQSSNEFSIKENLTGSDDDSDCQQIYPQEKNTIDNNSFDESNSNEFISIIEPHRARLIDSDPRYIRKKNNYEESDLLYDDGDIQVNFFDARQMKLLDKINDFKIPKFIKKENINLLKKKIEQAGSIEINYVLTQKEHNYSQEENGILGNIYSTEYSDTPDKVLTFELKNMPKFDINEIKNSQTCNASFTIYNNRNQKLVFHGRFVIEQTFYDIVDFVGIFMREYCEVNDNSQFSVLLSYGEKSYFKVNTNMKIMYIRELINQATLHFVINMNNSTDKNDFYSIRIPVFQTIPVFEKKCLFKYLGNIEESCESLLNKCKHDLGIVKQLYMFDYIENEHRFIPIDSKESIVHLSSRRNVRIQTHEIGNDSILFFFDNTPFLYIVQKNTTKDDLTNKIKNYLNRNISLKFYNKSQEEVDDFYINSNVLESFNKGLFEYIVVQENNRLDYKYISEY